MTSKMCRLHGLSHSPKHIDGFDAMVVKLRDSDNNLVLHKRHIRNFRSLMDNSMTKLHTQNFKKLSQTEEQSFFPKNKVSILLRMIISF